jgi:hypothetical protein
LNQHRNPERQGKNAAGEGGPVGKVISGCHLSVVTDATAPVVV